jgi:hypothetical protein
MLALVAMQKLASSSVAVVAAALRGRLARFEDARARAESSRRVSTDIDAIGDEDDDRNALDEQIVQADPDLRLTDGEEDRLRELVVAAETVTSETKIARVLELVRTRFSGRSVLLFTEYKATQALMMSALHPPGAGRLVQP